MGLYKRKDTGIYYIKKTVNGKTYRFSTGTSDHEEALSIWNAWWEDNLPTVLKLKGHSIKYQREKQAREDDDNVSLLESYCSDDEEINL